MTTTSEVNIATRCWLKMGFSKYFESNTILACSIIFYEGAIEEKPFLILEARIHFRCNCLLSSDAGLVRYKTISVSLFIKNYTSGTGAVNFELFQVVDITTSTTTTKKSSLFNKQNLSMQLLVSSTDRNELNNNTTQGI